MNIAQMIDGAQKFLIWLLCFSLIVGFMLWLYRDRTPPDKDYQESRYYDTGL